jgi:cellulose synthase/poly-beta-1,6-N-acetylglucosamine synthase-like glycosyltransferase
MYTPSMQQTTASVVIATRGRPGLLRRCLSALHEQDVAPTDVIVVDNSEGDEATRTVALEGGARYLTEPLGGISRARNSGACAARTDVVAYLDDDSVPDRGWLSALLAEFRDPRVAAVSGRILAFAQQDEERVLFGGPDRLAIDDTTPDWFERASFGGIGQGANLAIRRCLPGWAGFDARLGGGTRMGGAEEHHALFGLVDRGYRVVYSPAARVHHPYPDTAAEIRTLRLRQLESAGAHLAFLVAEERRYRWRAARYGLQALAGRPRAWRTQPPGRPLGRWDTARAGVRGIGVYVRMRLDTGAERDRS